MPVVAPAHCAVIVGGAIVIPQLSVVVVAWIPSVESVTVTAKENGPAVVGVPVIAPVVAFSVRPGGSAPELTVNVYGARPPVTVIAELYGVPTVPVMVAAHCAVMVGGAIVIPQLLVIVPAAVPLESVTCAVKLNGPAVVGVPVIAPVVAFSVRPGGRDPVTIE
jgi:hypothetical protein